MRGAWGDAGENLFTLLAKRGRLHLQTQKLALVVITQEAEAHSLCSISLSHSLGTVAR